MQEVWPIPIRHERRRITSADLSQVLQTVHKEAFREKSNTTWTVDLELAHPFLERKGLLNHIVTHERRGRTARNLRGVRRVYGLSNLILRHLDVDLEHHWKVGRDLDRMAGRCWFEWHFERCRFYSRSPNMNSLTFDWYGVFRFHRCKFDFGDSRGMRHWSLLFERGSFVSLQENDFEESSLQIGCSAPKERADELDLVWEGQRARLIKDSSYYATMIRRKYGLPDSAHLHMPYADSGRYGLRSLSLLGNKGIDELTLRCHASRYDIRGINHIRHLSLEELETDLQDHQDFDIYFGAREKIDLVNSDSLHHRRLFVALRKAASDKQDSRLMNTLDKQIDRIEYYLTKEQKVSFLKDMRGWGEYLQDILLYGWRSWSSDFYRSWFKPLLLLVVGYAVCNAFPFIWIEQFTALDWLSFSLRPINKMPFFAAELQDMFKAEYQNLPPASKIWLRLIGLLQLIWIAMCGFAFSRSVKR